MATDVWTYSRLLAEQLRINGVPESRVREIVAQVEGHVAATGDDPVTTFGQPVDYAGQWKSLSPRRWAGQLLLAVPPALGATCAVLAAFADRPWTGGVPVGWSVIAQFCLMFCILGAVPWTVGLLESRRRGSRFGDSAPPSVWPTRLAVVVAFGVVVGALSWLLDGAAEPTVLFEVTRWVLVVVAVLGLAGGVFMGPAPNSAGQPVAAPGLPHRPWKARVRRAFINR